jgi:hypothetical protein
MRAIGQRQVHNLTCTGTEASGRQRSPDCARLQPQAIEKEPSMPAKKIVGWLIVVFVVWYLLTNPDGAAHFGQHVLNGLRSAGQSLAKFVSSL